MTFCSTAWAKPRLPPKELKGDVVNDLPLPFNLQAVVLNNSAALSWVWQPLEQGPLLDSFGYEVRRDNVTMDVVSGTTYTDFHVAVGSHTYKVRARGDAKQGGKRIAHVSDWSESAEAVLKTNCSRAPQVFIAVEPTKQIYKNIPALRLHVTGTVTQAAGCSSTGVAYHIDSGLGAPRTGPLALDAKGHFDEFIDAVGPDEEPPPTNTSYRVAVTADNEWGTTTSNVYTVQVYPRNKFAPQ